MTGKYKDAERQTCQGGTESVECIDQHFGLIHPQTHQARGLLVAAFIAAYGIDRSANARIVRHVDRESKQQETHHDRDGDIRGRFPLPDIVLHQSRDEDLRFPQDLEGGIVDEYRIIADEKAHSAGEPKTCKGCDEWLYFQVGNETAHDRAKEHAHQEHEGDHKPGIHALAKQNGGGNSSERHHTSDG